MGNGVFIGTIVDIVFLPSPHTEKPALVIELKYGKAASAAIQQIKDRHYTQALEGYSGRNIACRDKL